MQHEHEYDTIIIGGSYAGLSAAMALGRAFRKVLIIDSGNPCNRTAPLAHNFLTQDGKSPKDIAVLAKADVSKYNSVSFFHGIVDSADKTDRGFSIGTSTGEQFSAGNLIFATGLEDYFPPIPGYADCWGISVLHCPYCHGYEVADEVTGVLGNGDNGFDLAVLISNWTKHLTLFTNGPSALTHEQTSKLRAHDIRVVENTIKELKHHEGQLEAIIHTGGSKSPINFLYARFPLKQQSNIPEVLGCELTADGYLRVDDAQETTVKGIYACGDNSNRVRTLSNAVGTGTTAGMSVSKRMIAAEF